MKSLSACFESILDDDDVFYDPENDKKAIEDWIKDNYKVTGKLTISDEFVVNCTGSVFVNNKSIESLANDLFRWGSVGRDFFCALCNKLTSLEGSPKNVGDSFNCSRCDSLVNLEGAPEKVGGSFYCRECENLTSLEGAPEEVDGGFDCTGCENLTSLEGAPKKVGRDFDCRDCKSLTSLKGAPEKIGGNLVCLSCDSLKITDSDRKKYKIMD